MTAVTVLADLLQNGIEPTISDDGQHIEVPAGCLTEAQRHAILACKPELIDHIKEAERVTSELLAAAMRACDYWQDSPEAREQMRRECLAVPPELREELRQHFEREYPPEAGR